MLPLIQFLLLVAFPALAIIAAMRDATSFTIPNWISLALIALFFPTALLLGASLTQIGLAVAVGFGALIVGMGMFAAGWIGGGDAKLAAVTALWFGFEQLMPYLTLAAIGGGVLTFALLKLRSGPLPQVATGWSWARRLHSPKEGVPYGIALAFAALLVLPDSALWRAAMGL